MLCWWPAIRCGSAILLDAMHHLCLAHPKSDRRVLPHHCIRKNPLPVSPDARHAAYTNSHSYAAMIYSLYNIALGILQTLNSANRLSDSQCGSACMWIGRMWLNFAQVVCSHIRWKKNCIMPFTRDSHEFEHDMTVWLECSSCAAVEVKCSGWRKNT